jgi:O-antigen/teichoic acid export membrane protein
MINQLKAGAILSFIALVLNSVVSLLYTPVMLKTLGQAEYGLFVLATSTIGYIGILNFGLGNAVIRYIAKYKVMNDKEGESSLYGMFTGMYAILGTLAFIVGMIITFSADNLFGGSLSPAELEKIQTLMFITVLNLTLTIGLGAFSFIILGHEKFVFQKFIVILGAVSSPLISWPFLLNGYDSVAIITITTLVNIVVIACNIYFCFKVIRIKISFKRIEMPLVKEVLLFSSFLFINLIVEKIYWSTDQIILGVFTGTVAVSIYALGASFSGYFAGFSQAICNVFLARVSAMVAKKAPDSELSDLFIKIGRIQFIVLSFALSGFVVFGYEFIDLWIGKDYEESYLIAILIAVPLIISLMQEMGNIILQAKNIQKFKTFVYLGVSIFNVLLSLVLVGRWGALGCAIATAVAFFVNLLIMNIYFWKKIHLDVPKFWFNIVKMSFPLILTLFGGLYVNNQLPNGSWSLFFIKISLFSILFVLLMWFTGMNAYEKNLTKSFLNRLRPQSHNFGAQSHKN